jgi:hypothetical protein
MVAQADDSPGSVLHLRLLAAPDLKMVDHVAVSKDVHVFGRQVANTSVLIDPETRGLGNVFVWTAASRSADLPAPCKVVRRVYLANGNYVPCVLVANEGDELEVDAIDPVTFIPRTDFPELPGCPPGRLPYRFILTGFVNQPVSLTCNTYPWLRADIFVQRGVRCATSDRLGRAQLTVSGAGERARVFVQHAYLGRLRVSEAPEGVNQPAQGIIDIRPELFREGEEITLTVNEEQEESASEDEPRR